MINYGYFENVDVEPERLSFHDVETAQINYAEKLTAHMLDKSLPVLDIGCGIGGIANMIHQKGFTVEVLSPNISQLTYVKKNYPALTAFSKADQIIASGGRWIISDYFSIQSNDQRKPGRRFEDFEQLAAEHGWNIIYQEDITCHVLPTLKFANMYITRVVNPVLFYLENKLLVKMAWLYHLTHDMRDKLITRLMKEFSKVDAGVFLSEKKYLILVLTKGCEQIYRE